MMIIASFCAFSAIKEMVLNWILLKSGSCDLSSVRVMSVHHLINKGSKFILIVTSFFFVENVKLESNV